MDNMGGLRKLFLIDAEYFVSLTEASGNLYTLVLDENVIISEIEFSSDSGKISETEELTDNGLLFNYETTCKVPKCGPVDAEVYVVKRQKKLLVLAEDNNGNFWLTGFPGSYFNMTISSDTGASAQDLNSRQLKISASLSNPSVFINPLP
jgi:hypothetical protein